MENKDITIVMVTYNGLDDTVNCLNSLEKTNYPYKLLVVDNFSNPETLEYLRGRGIDTIYLKERVGVFEAFHIGALKVKTKYMAYIHQDMTFPNPAWLEDHLRGYQDGHMLMINQYYSGREVRKRSIAAGFMLYSFIMTTETYLECPVDWRYNLYIGDLEHQLRFVQKYGIEKWSFSDATNTEHRGGVIVRERSRDTAHRIHREDLALFRKINGDRPIRIVHSQLLFKQKKPVIEIPERKA